MKPLHILRKALSTLIGGAGGGRRAAVERKTVIGHPVYKFIHLTRINRWAPIWERLMARGTPGWNHEGPGTHHREMVSADFHRHELLRVVGQDGRELEIYIRAADHRELWRTNPHDLYRQGKSHLVTIGYEEIRVGGRTVNRAASFHAELVNRKPILRK